MKLASKACPGLPPCLPPCLWTDFSLSLTHPGSPRAQHCFGSPLRPAVPPTGIYTSPTFFIRISSGIMPPGRGSHSALDLLSSLTHSKPSGWFLSIQFCFHWTRGLLVGHTGRHPARIWCLWNERTPELATGSVTTLDLFYPLPLQAPEFLGRTGRANGWE